MQLVHTKTPDTLKGSAHIEKAQGVDFLEAEHIADVLDEESKAGLI